jgi:hypothetical protein
MLNETLSTGLAAAALQIAATYHTDVARVRSDLQAFVQDLESKHLIYQVKRRSCPVRQRHLFARLVLLPVLRVISLCPLSLEQRSWALLAVASMAIRLFGWPGTVAGWHVYLQKHALRCAAGPFAHIAHTIDKVIRSVAASHPFHVECKERALCGWWFLSTAGFSPALMVGISLFPLECHCWCEARQSVIGDTHERCEQFTPILSYTLALA